MARGRRARALWREERDLDGVVLLEDYVCSLSKSMLGSMGVLLGEVCSEDSVRSTWCGVARDRYCTFGNRFRDLEARV